MDLFEKKSGFFSRGRGILLSVFVLAVLCVAFYQGVAYTSQKTLRQEQSTLENALVRGAVHAYALNGEYPESLEALIREYPVTYDPSKFIVEYVPTASNLLPSISVIPLGRQGKEAAS